MALLTDIDDVKKKLAKLEEETKFKLKQMEESFALFRDIIIQMQKEKSELERKNLLLEKENLLLKRQKKPITAPIKDTVEKIGERVVKPVRAEFDDTVELFKEALKEDSDSNEEVSYIEIAEPVKEEKMKTTAEEDVVSKDNQKKRAVQWIREKYGIVKKSTIPGKIRKKKRKMIAS